MAVEAGSFIFRPQDSNRAVLTKQARRNPGADLLEVGNGMEKKVRLTIYKKSGEKVCGEFGLYEALARALHHVVTRESVGFFFRQA